MKRILFALLVCLLPFTARAESILLDAEGMDYLKQLATPLLEAAQIPVESVTVFIIDDPQINAFVTPEKRIYFYTGLIEKADNANQLQGILAHEIGHIKGRHYLKAMALQDKLKWPMLISAVVGTGAMIAAGASDVGQAVMTGGLAASLSNMLRFSRGQEQQADQIGLQLLGKTTTSPLGLAQFFDKLQLESTLFASTPPAYLLTHPMPAARMDFIRQYLPTGTVNTPAPPTPEFTRVKARIMALVDTPGQTLRKYMQGMQDNADALYAKCIAYALQGKKKESLNLINKLLQKSPDDFFYRELKAQLLVDHGDVKEAVDIYSEITKERDLPLVHLQYADALVAVDRAAEAIPYYNRVIRAFPEWASVHHRIGIAYGKAGELAASHIALSQEAILDEKLDEAQLHLNTAEKYLDKANEATKQRFETLKEALTEAKEEE